MSIHRKIGDIYEACVKLIFMATLNLTAENVISSATIRSGDVEETRTADAYLQFDRLEKSKAKRIAAYCRNELRKLKHEAPSEPRGSGHGSPPLLPDG